MHQNRDMLYTFTRTPLEHAALSNAPRCSASQSPPTKRSASVMTTGPSHPTESTSIVCTGRKGEAGKQKQTEILRKIKYKIHSHGGSELHINNGRFNAHPANHTTPPFCLNHSIISTREARRSLRHLGSAVGHTFIIIAQDPVTLALGYQEIGSSVVEMPVFIARALQS